MTDFYLYKGSNKFFEDIKLKDNPRTGDKKFFPDKDLSAIREEYLKEENTIWTEYDTNRGRGIIPNFNMSGCSGWYVQDGELSVSPKYIFEGYLDDDFEIDHIYASKRNLKELINSLNNVFDHMKSRGVSISMGLLMENAFIESSSKWVDNLKFKEKDVECNKEIICSSSIETMETFIEDYESMLDESDFKKALILMHRAIESFGIDTLFSCLCVLDSDIIDKFAKYVEIRENLKGEKGE